MKTKSEPNRTGLKSAPFKSQPATRTPLPLPTSSLARIPAYDQIAARARVLWQEKGCPQDRDEEIWLQAERELSREAGETRRTKPPAGTASDSKEDEGEQLEAEERLDEMAKPADNRSATSL